MGIEPTTYSLGSCRSTTELRPQIEFFRSLAPFWLQYHSQSLWRVQSLDGFAPRVMLRDWNDPQAVSAARCLHARWRLLHRK
jgi:hypothetical protein